MNKKSLVPKGFRPDFSPYNTDVVQDINNLIPYSRGCRGMPDFASGFGSLPSACLGAISVRLPSGTAQLFAGTATKLYRYNVGTSSFDDVTRSSGGDYAVSDGSKWSFAYMEDRNGPRLIAQNGSDACQYFDLTSGTNFTALPNAPVARFCTVSGNFLVMGALDGDNAAIAWSGVNDSEFWTYGQRGADYQPFNKGGPVQGVLGSDDGFVIFQFDMMRYASRVPSVLVFAIRVLQENIGCIAPYAILNVGSTFLWYSQDGFKMGVDAEPIGLEHVDQWFLETVANDDIKLLSGAIDRENKVAWWVIPTSDTVNVLLGFAWPVAQWTKSDLNMDFITEAISSSITFGDLSAYTFATLPYTFGATFYQGDQLRTLAGFQSDNSFGYFQGSKRAADITFGDILFNDIGNSFIHSAETIGEIILSNIQLTLLTRDTINGSRTTTGPFTPDSKSERCDFNVEGRSHALKVEIASHNWETFTRVVFQYSPAGNV